ncbi:MAG: LamG domain-containing protein [Caulobacteraceae bacterium]|nr:LamG domain-containing protein [Caulobacteraceae bacterium]
MIAAAFAGGGAAVSDPYFEYTTLLLPGNGTNGAQNNTFLDSSTNNFTITRNGNTTQGTFSPFSQTGWSNYFNGVDDTLISSGTPFNFGANDFTIEMWVYPLPVASFKVIINTNSTGGVGGGINSNGTITVGRALLATDGTTSNSVTFNAWNHIAWVRNSGTLKIYINGVEGFSGTISTNYPNGALRLGSDNNNTLYYPGYISNVRLSPSAVYTNSFTPSTSPLTVSTSPTILTAQSNRFLDNSGNGLTFTTQGSPSVQAFSPFNPSASWSAATYGGSGYFDGTGDYLSVADNSNLRLGTNAFTIQGWVYRNASGAAHSIIAKGGASTGFVLQVTSTNILRFTHGTTNVDTTTTIPASAWTHIAAVRTNTSTNGFQLYINGVSSATATVSTNFNQTDTLYAGADRSAANVMNGFISGLKYTNGTAESIAVPTEPPTATTNVALLLNYTNAGIYDATSKNDLETVGNAQISTAQSKWGGSSMAFDGTGDWLLISDQPIQRIGTGNFTIEGWVYRNSSGTYGLIGKGTGTTGWLVSLNSSNQVVFTYGSSTITSTGTVSATTWTHIAVVREGTSTNQTKIYINGTNDGTGTVNTDFNQTNSMYVGADRTGGSAANAYMQDVRVTNYARYTTTFTPPTSAFPTL